MIVTVAMAWLVLTVALTCSFLVLVRCAVRYEGTCQATAARTGAARPPAPMPAPHPSEQSARPAGPPGATALV